LSAAVKIFEGDNIVNNIEEQAGRHWWQRAALGMRLGVVAVSLALGWSGSAAAKTADDITVVINQSPWLDGFAKLVSVYEKETGNKVTLDVNPYAGSLEKQRNAVHAKTSEYALLIINGIFYAEMYHGGFLEPLQNIDPSFKLDPKIYSFDDTPYYDAAKKTVNAKTGKLMTVPVNPNITLMFYRKDLYEQKGLKIPETWDQLLANAKALNDPPKIYGIVQRGARGAISVTWDFFPYLMSYGGSLFANEKGGDFTVTLNSPQALAALKMYLKLAHEAGPKNVASVDQAEEIQLLVTGRAAQAVLPIAAYAQMDDPNKSAVVGKIGYMNLPHAPGFASAPSLGHWLAGIPKNIPDAKKHAALAFLKWFQQPKNQIKYAELGGSPVSAAAFESEFANRPENRYMKTVVKALPMARQLWTIPEGAQIVAVTEVGLNRIVAGELDPAKGLNAMAADIEKIVAAAGYKTGKLPELK
jgi:multiple sugar transport system substrate-binding protein